MKVLGALVAMVPFASSLVPFGQPAAHQLAVSADRKGAPLPKSSGLRQPRKASRDKKAPGLGARLASALLPSCSRAATRPRSSPTSLNRPRPCAAPTPRRAHAPHLRLSILTPTDRAHEDARQSRPSRAIQTARRCLVQPEPMQEAPYLGVMRALA